MYIKKIISSRFQHVEIELLHCDEDRESEHYEVGIIDRAVEPYGMILARTSFDTRDQAVGVFTGYTALAVALS